MVNWLLSWWLRRLGGTPCFQIYGKGRRESEWRIVNIYATPRRNADSRWPLWRGTCITWTRDIVVVGRDFAEIVLREQAEQPASRDRPVSVAGGRLGDWRQRVVAGASSQCSASEVLAHECGHTEQTLYLHDLYLPLVGAVTLLREGPHWWNHFENQASEQGLFGGLVNGSVCAELMRRLNEGSERG